MDGGDEAREADHEADVAQAVEGGGIDVEYGDHAEAVDDGGVEEANHTDNGQDVDHVLKGPDIDRGLKIGCGYKSIDNGKIG